MRHRPHGRCPQGRGQPTGYDAEQSRADDRDRFPGTLLTEREAVQGGEGELPHRSVHERDMMGHGMDELGGHDGDTPVAGTSHRNPSAGGNGTRLPDQSRGHVAGELREPRGHGRQVQQQRPLGTRADHTDAHVDHHVVRSGQWLILVDDLALSDAGQDHRPHRASVRNGSVQDRWPDWRQLGISRLSPMSRIRTVELRHYRWASCGHCAPGG